MGLGVGEIIGGIMSGQLQDNLPSRVVIIINMVELVIAVAILCYYTLNNHYTLWYALILNFFWGLQDSGLNNFIYCIAGFQFESKTLPFALYFFIQSFFCFVGIFLQALLKTSVSYMVYFAVLAAFSLFAWLLFMFAFDIKLDEKQL